MHGFVLFLDISFSVNLTSIRPHFQHQKRIVQQELLETCGTPAAAAAATAPTIARGTGLDVPRRPEAISPRVSSEISESGRERHPDADERRRWNAFEVVVQVARGAGKVSG